MRHSMNILGVIGFSLLVSGLIQSLLPETAPVFVRGLLGFFSGYFISTQTMKWLYKPDTEQEKIE